MKTTRDVLRRTIRKMTTILALTGAVGAMVIAAPSPGAQLPFVEPSFENGGSPTMGADYVASGHGNNAASTLATDKWHMRSKDNGQEGFILEDKDSYKGFTSAPAGASGEQFITGSRGNNFRGLFQYIQDNKATTGKITATIDNWVHELKAIDPVAGAGDLSFEVIAFDDPATVNVDLGGTADIVTGSGFISTGDSYQTVSVADAATGFQELQATLDLGAGGYNYIGVAVATSKNGLNPYNNASGNTASFDNLQVTTAGGGGDPVVYEGFNYPAGDVDGSQAGGTGFAAAGWTTTGFTQNPYDVRSDGLTFPGLPMLGGSVRRPAAPDEAEMHREISPAAQTALTADNSTVWFSVLTRDDEYSEGNANAALVLGTDAFDGPGNKPVTMTSGNALGLAIDGQSGGFDLHAIAIENGSTSLSADSMLIPIGEDTTYLIAGKLDWAPDGSDDTLTLYNIIDPTSDTLPAPFATITADLDQSAFDTIAIGDRQITPFDEIRFATTFADAMARQAAVDDGVIPEPATMCAVGLAVAGLGGYVRKRRRA